MKNNFFFSDIEKKFITHLRVARIASINLSDNFPHIVPICYVFYDGSFYTSLSKNSKRLKNLNEKSEVSILFDEYKEKNGEWVILRGIFVKVDFEVLNYTEDSKIFMNGWTKLIEKYPQYKAWAHKDLTPTDPDLRRIMKMKPIEKVSWGFS